MAMDKTLLLNAQAEKCTRGETCVGCYFCVIHDETQQCGSSAVTVSGLCVCATLLCGDSFRVDGSKTNSGICPRTVCNVAIKQAHNLL